MPFDFITDLLARFGATVPQAGIVLTLLYTAWKWRRAKSYAGKGASLISYIIVSGVIIAILLVLGVISGFHPDRLINLGVEVWQVVGSLF